MGINNRRKFLKQTGAAAAGVSILPNLSWAQISSNNANRSNEILRNLSAFNDERVTGLLKDQLNKPGDRWDGGVVNIYDLPNVHSTCWFIVRTVASYASKFSKYYKAPELEGPLSKAMACMLNVQHEDGTIDLHSTNFHSTPDTAFLVNYLSPAYVCLQRMNPPGLEGFLSQLKSFFLNSGKCLLVGGIHTANHRWVVSSALARLYDFFGNEKYLERMDEWLAEGIDVDPDGQYTERSVSIYSPTCNDMFLTIGRLLDRADLMDVVRTNLAMSLYYIQPGGEVLTDASHRQDSAYVGFVNRYYYGYRYFAIKDQNPEFAAVCRLMEEQMPERISDTILMLLEDSHFGQKMPDPGKIPDNYFKRFVHSDVFRIRRGNIDISVIEQNPTFLSYRKGNAVMQSMRLGASFFGKGQFVAEQTEVSGNTIIMKWSLTKGYYQPVPEDKRKGENDWAIFPRDERELSEAQSLDMTVTITETSGRLSIDAEITGTDHVPVTWEMSFRANGVLKGVVQDKSNPDVYFLEDGIGQYEVGEDVISFGNGMNAHKWAQMRGLLPKQEGLSVYITGNTPFRHTLELG